MIMNIWLYSGRGPSLILVRINYLTKSTGIIKRSVLRNQLKKILKKS